MVISRNICLGAEELYGFGYHGRKPNITLLVIENMQGTQTKVVISTKSDQNWCFSRLVLSCQKLNYQFLDNYCRYVLDTRTLPYRGNAYQMEKKMRA